MNSEYLVRLFAECHQELDVYDELTWKDHRGFVEFFVEEPHIMSIVIKTLLSHGWSSSHFSDPKRLLVGESFDMSGDDFLGLRVLISIRHLNDWAQRYVGNVRKPDPALTSALNEYVSGRTILDEVLEAERRRGKNEC